MEFVITWLVLSPLVGILAHSRGRSGFVFFLISLLLSPLIGFIILLVIRNPREEERKERLRQEDHERQLESIKAAVAPIQSADQGTPLGSTSFVADEIKKLAELRTQGLLTDDEFQAQKSVLLNSSKTLSHVAPDKTTQGNEGKRGPLGEYVDPNRSEEPRKGKTGLLAAGALMVVAIGVAFAYHTQSVPDTAPQGEQPQTQGIPEPVPTDANGQQEAAAPEQPRQEANDYENGLVVRTNLSLDAISTKYPSACTAKYCEIENPDQEICPSSQGCLKVVYTIKGGTLVLFTVDYGEEAWRALLAITKARYGDPIFQEVKMPRVRDFDIGEQDFEFKTDHGFLTFKDYHGIDLLGSGSGGPTRSFVVWFTTESALPQQPDAEKEDAGKPGEVDAQPTAVPTVRPDVMHGEAF